MCTLKHTEMIASPTNQHHASPTNTKQNAPGLSREGWKALQCHVVLLLDVSVVCSQSLAKVHKPPQEPVEQPANMGKVCCSHSENASLCLNKKGMPCSYMLLIRKQLYMFK
jgi:hypothetical protein